VCEIFLAPAGSLNLRISDEPQKFMCHGEGAQEEEVKKFKVRDFKA